MNYQQEQLRNALAAEYVLGTLSGPARKRFQQLMMESQSIREATWVWEQHLNGLGEKLEPVEPSPNVWKNIQYRLGMSPPRTTPVTHLNRAAKRFWQSTALVATAAAFILAILIVRQDLPKDTFIPETREVAIFVDTESAPLWLIDITQDNIEIQTTSNLEVKSNNDYQLWMVAKDGRPPISLGILPQKGKITLPKHVQFDQLDIAALAVSLEPLGGSPNGQPTTVLYTAELVST